jgi:hypothetical protein
MKHNPNSILQHEKHYVMPSDCRPKMPLVVAFVCGAIGIAFLVMGVLINR